MFTNGINPSSDATYGSESNANVLSDYNIVRDTMRSHLLVRRGQFILGLIITSWVYMAFNWLMHLVSIRRKEQAAANALPPA